MKRKIKIRGRKPHIDNIRKAKEYRNKGLSYAEIAKIMDKDRSQVFRWVSYEVEENEK